MGLQPTQRTQRRHDSEELNGDPGIRLIRRTIALEVFREWFQPCQSESLTTTELLHLLALRLEGR